MGAISVSAPPDLPIELQQLSGGDWTEFTVGESDAAVWRINFGSSVMFLKAERRHPLSEVPAEVSRLQWLAETGIPALKVIDCVTSSDRYWLLMTAVPGSDLTHMADRPAELCRVYASSLRRLHALDVSACPFDHSLDRRLAVAAANVAAGRIREDQFDEERQGWTAGEMLAWVQTHQPPSGDRVVTHGDACVPNIIAHDGRFSGFVDCARLGVADPWQDLALACRSLIQNCGREHVQGFLDAYGTAWDEERYRYYGGLDNLF
jgi:aminoglycoside 3'-phosphotransferase-2